MERLFVERNFHWQHFNSKGRKNLVPQPTKPLTPAELRQKIIDLTSLETAAHIDLPKNETARKLLGLAQEASHIANLPVNEESEEQRKIIRGLSHCFYAKAAELLERIGSMKDVNEAKKQIEESHRHETTMKRTLENALQKTGGK